MRKRNTKLLTAYPSEKILMDKNGVIAATGSTGQELKTIGLDRKSATEIVNEVIAIRVLDTWATSGKLTYGTRADLKLLFKNNEVSYLNVDFDTINHIITSTDIPLMRHMEEDWFKLDFGKVVQSKSKRYLYSSREEFEELQENSLVSQEKYLKDKEKVSKGFKIGDIYSLNNSDKDEFIYLGKRWIHKVSNKNATKVHLFYGVHTRKFKMLNNIMPFMVDKIRRNDVELAYKIIGQIKEPNLGEFSTDFISHIETFNPRYGNTPRFEKSGIEDFVYGYTSSLDKKNPEFDFIKEELSEILNKDNRKYVEIHIPFEVRNKSREYNEDDLKGNKGTLSQFILKLYEKKRKDKEV